MNSFDTSPGGALHLMSGKDSKSQQKQHILCTYTKFQLRVYFSSIFTMNEKIPTRLQGRRYFLWPY
jgi:hypothetical protein